MVARFTRSRTRAVQKTACDVFGFCLPRAAVFQEAIGHAEARTGSGAADRSIDWLITECPSRFPENDKEL